MRISVRRNTRNSPGPKRSPKGVELCNDINHYMFIPNRRNPRNLIVSLLPECAVDGYLIENTWKARMREHIADLIRLIRHRSGPVMQDLIRSLNEEGKLDLINKLFASVVHSLSATAKNRVMKNMPQ